MSDGDYAPPYAPLQPGGLELDVDAESQQPSSSVKARFVGAEQQDPDFIKYPFGLSDLLPRFVSSVRVNIAVLWVIALIALILAATALGESREGIADLWYTVEHKPPFNYCKEFGDKLFGDEVLTTSDGVSAYQVSAPARTPYLLALWLHTDTAQIVGSPQAAISWKQAQWDSSSRCYDGKQGHLASIDNALEQVFVFNALQSKMNHVSFEGNAWIGERT